MSEDITNIKRLDFLREIADKYIVDPSNQKTAFKLIEETKAVFENKKKEKTEEVNYETKYKDLLRQHEEALTMLTPKKLVELQMKKLKNE